MSNLYPGDMLELGVTFRDASKQPRDPTAVKVQVDGPGNVEEYVYGVDPEVTRTAQGTYLLQRPLTDADVGIWIVEWEGTGAVHATTGGRFRVLPPRIPG